MLSTRTTQLYDRRRDEVSLDELDGDRRGDDRRIAGHRCARNFAQPFSRHRTLGELAR
jgi:hypothetical protein